MAELFVIKNDSIASGYSVEPALNGGYEVRSLSNHRLH